MRALGQRKRRLRKFGLFESLEARQMLNAAPVANDDHYSVLQDTVLAPLDQVSYPRPESFPGLREIQSIAINYDATQIEYSQPYNLLFVREGTTRIHVFDATTGVPLGIPWTRPFYVNFIDMDLTPDGRYLYAADDEGAGGFVHRFDADNRTWIFKFTSIFVNRIEAVDAERFLAQDAAGYRITLNHFGASPTDPITELTSIRGGSRGDFKYDARSGRIYHGSTYTKGNIQVREIVDNQLVFRESTESFGPSFGDGSVVLSTDGEYFYYGRSRVRTSNVRNVQPFPVVQAATAGLVFTSANYRSAATGEYLGPLGYSTGVFGVSDHTNVIWTFDWENQRLRGYEIPYYPLYGVMVNDSDADQDQLEAQLVVTARKGTVDLNHNGQFIYTPESGFVGEDSFAYQLTDSAGNKSAPATVTIEVRPWNTAPVAINDKYILDYNTTLSVTKPPPGEPGRPELTEIGSILTDYDVSQVEFAQHAGLLFVRDGAQRIRIIDVAGGVEIAQHAAGDEFVDFDLTSDARYLYALEFGGQDVFDTVRPSWIHRFDTATRQWDVKQAPASGKRIEAVDANRFLLSVPVYPAKVTLNDFGSLSGVPIVELGSVTDNSGAQLDMEYDPRTAVLYTAIVGTTPVIKAYRISDRSIAFQASSGPLPAPESSPLTLSVDGKNLFYGPLQFSLPDISAIDRAYLDNITASSDGVAYSVNSIYSAATGERIGRLELSGGLVTAAPDGQHLVTYDGDGGRQLRVYQTRPLGWGVLANDHDNEGDRLTASVVSYPDGLLFLNGDGSFQFKPRDGFYGTTSFSYIASDGRGDSPVAIVELVVADPYLVVNPESYWVTEDVPFEVSAAQGVLANDKLLPGEVLAPFVDLPPSHGKVQLQSDGSFRYVPDANYFGKDSFSYRLDGESTVSAATMVTLNIASVPDAPVAVADHYSVPEDLELVVVDGLNVLANDADVEGDRLTAALVDAPNQGSLQFDANGDFTYQPNSNFFGKDQFTYRVFDGSQYSEAATVVIDVLPFADQPVGVADQYSLEEDGALFVPASEGVLGNDFDPDLEPFHLYLVTRPLYGKLVLNDDGSFRYVPDVNFYGEDFFVYALYDGQQTSEPVRVSLNVAGVIDGPAMMDDSYSTMEDTPLIVGRDVAQFLRTIPGNFNDVAFDRVTNRFFASSANGFVHVINPESGTIERSVSVGSGAHPLALAEEARFLYVGLDNSGTIARLDLRSMQVDQRFEAWKNFDQVFKAARIDVFPQNPDKIIVALVPLKGGSENYIRILEGGLGPNPISSNARFAINNDGSAHFLLNYSPGVVSRVWDVSPPPFHLYGASIQLSGGPLDIEWANGNLYTGSGQVIDGISMTEVACFPTTGEVTVDPQSDRIYFRNGARIDAYALSTQQYTGALTIPEITNAVGEPVRFGADGLAFATTAGLVLVKSNLISGNPYGGVLRNDNNVDGVPLSATISTPPQHGALTMHADGSFAYYPAPNYHGIDSFTYDVHFDKYHVGATVTIRVDPVNDLPQVNSDTYYFTSGSLSVDTSKGVLTNDVDLEATKLIAMLAKGPEYGDLQLASDGAFVYTPGPSFQGADSFTYKVTDGEAASGEAAVTVAFPIRMVTDAKTLALPPDTASEGFFNVRLEVPTGFDFWAASYDVSVHTDPNSGIKLQEALFPALARESLFFSVPTFTLVPDGLLVSGSSPTSPAYIDNGDVLFRVRYSVPAGFEGNVPVTFTVAATNLFDGDSHPLPIYRETDKIEVTRLPSPVANVQLAAVAPNRVKVTWNSIEGDYTGFRIERSSSTGGDFVVLATLDADVSEFEDGHLQSATSYVYRIIAFNEAGDALGSVSQQVTTPQLTEIRGTEGNETYYVTRSGNLLQVYQNGEPTGPPTYSSAVGDLPQSITIDSLGGYDELVVGTGQESTLGLERLIFKGNGSGKRVTIENGTVRVDSLMEDNTALQTTVEPGAHLISGRLSQDALTISPHARVTLLADSGTSVVHRLNIGAGAVLDIGNNALVIDHWDEPWWPEAVENWIKSGRGGAGIGQGAWNGTGITSSAAAQANQTAPESQAIGYAENAALPLGPYSTFRGVPVDDTSILIAFTKTGDANLDGVVNDDDDTILGATYAPAATGASWALADFDYNGRVDDDDATLLGAFYDPSASAQLFSLAGLAVEPTRRSLPARPNESVVELLARYRAESQGQPSDSVWLDWQ